MAGRRLFGQFGIADLLLVIAVAAAWTAGVVNQSRVERLKSRIRSMQVSAGELVIHDRSRYNAIGQTVVRYPDDAWQVWLPEGRTYSLQLITREIRADGFASNAKAQSAEIQPGLHRIYLRQDRDEQGNPRLTVLLNDKTVLQTLESKDWNATGGSSSTGIGKTQDVQAVEKPLVLKRLREYVKLPNGSSQSPPNNQAANGLLLWINAL